MNRCAARALALVPLVAGCAGRLDPGGGSPAAGAAHTVAVGAGRYATVLSDGEKPPSNQRGEPVGPKVTPEFAGVPTSNDWWSSLIWEYDRGGARNPYSESMYPHPLTVAARARGLGIGYPTAPATTARTYFFAHKEDLLVGAEGLDAAETRVADYSDWAVTAVWPPRPGAGPRTTMTATFGHGLPFVYLRVRGGAAIVEPAGQAEIWSENGSVVGLTVGGHHYGLFAPAGTSWTRAAAGPLRAALGDKGVFSVAVLPDRTPATLELFRRHAYAFVTGTRVSWRYDQPAARVVTTFSLETTLVDEAPDLAPEPLVALYRHQWLHTNAPLVGELGYASARGRMRLLAGRSFETVLPFHGVLPFLPGGAAVDRGTLRRLIETVYRSDDLFPPGLENTRGSYWTGKSLQKIATLVWLADEIGYREARDRFVRALARKLEDWFDGTAPNLLYYDRTWATLIGLPQEYQSGWQMNDHHFHYGYFLFAAATVAAFDPAWAAPERFGGMVALLVKDVANWERADRRFPFLRYFDPYAGHSWANGPALFAEGNNQESSSEDVNFSVGALLWGAVTGDRAVRDLGVFLYANQVAAVEQYWFDVDRQVFPPGFDQPLVGMVWGAGAKYDTWWDRNPVYAHGINYLPFSGGSLYLGYHPDYVRASYQRLVRANRGEVRQWRDIAWMFLALSDPERAVALYDQEHYFEPEFGSSMASLYQWVHALAGLGQVDTSVSADAPTYAVFRRGDRRAHVAYNPEREARTVTFSDGAVVDVPAGGLRTITTTVGAR